MNNFIKIGFVILVLFTTVMVACKKDNDTVPETPPVVVPPEPEDTTGTTMDTMTNVMNPADTMSNATDTTMTGSATSEVSIENLLTNQINEIIIPTCENYKAKMAAFLSTIETLVGNINDANLTAVKAAYLEANLAYQAAAVHNYYATANLDLVNTTNLYPIDLDILADLIETEAYNFNVTAQQRANGFPALDYLLYGLDDPLATFSENAKTATFLLELVKAMDVKAGLLVDRWTGSLVENFINNGGVALGSSVSVQLNQTMVYYEDHVRENKVGIPIGRSGPNDTPFEADLTKIEGFYQSSREGNDNISLTLLTATIEEMEDTYLGTTASGDDGIGYEDWLISIEQESLDTDIKAQYQTIYDAISNRSTIGGDEDLYLAVQGLITLYKSDLFPVLNVQDADGSNDGD